MLRAVQQRPATPKNKTLEIFGEAYDAGGQTRHRPFHSYTMKQAIQEGFILDVLRHYTPVESYYKLIKKVEEDPEFDTKRARKKLRRYVEGHDYAIRLKAEIMVDHFHEQVLALRRVYRLTPTGTVMYGGVDTLRNVARARCIASASPDSAGIHRNPESIVFWANLAQNG